MVIGDLHRSKRITGNFELEIKVIKEKYLKVGYPKRFLQSIINNFNEPSENHLLYHQIYLNKEAIHSCRISLL